MGRPAKAEGRQTRVAILDAALELFAEKGYFGASLRDIAVRVGVRESALYNYFASKEALFIGLLESARENRTEQLAAYMAEPATDVRSALERLTGLVLDYFSGHKQQLLFRVLQSDGMRLAKAGRLDVLERMTNGSASLREPMQRLIETRQLKAADPDALVVAFCGPLMMWRYCHALNPHDPLIANREAFIRNHVTQFLDGAAVRPADAVRPRLARRTARRARSSAARSGRKSRV